MVPKLPPILFIVRMALPSPSLAVKLLFENFNEPVPNDSTSLSTMERVAFEGDPRSTPDGVFREILTVFVPSKSVLSKMGMEKVLAASPIANAKEPFVAM